MIKLLLCYHKVKEDKEQHTVNKITKGIKTLEDESVPLIKCIGCKREYPATTEYFHKSPAGKYGLKSRCKKCINKNGNIHIQKKEGGRTEYKKKYAEDQIDNKIDDFRQCNICQEIFPLTRDFFTRNLHSPQGFLAHCKECRNHKNLPEEGKFRKSMKQQGLKQCTECKEWKPTTGEHFHSNNRPSKPNTTPFANRCKECANKRAKEVGWQKNNPEASRTIKRGYTKRNQEKEKLRHSSYSKNHREEQNTQTRNYRAKKKLLPGTHTKEEIRDQYRRQDGKCYYCSRELNNKYHVDHIVPVTRENSSNDIHNLVIACHPCNASKGNRLLHEWPRGGRLI